VEITFINGVEIEILKTKVFNDGAKAFISEQKILSDNIHKRYYGNGIKSSGNTELFIEDIK